MVMKLQKPTLLQTHAYWAGAWQEKAETFTVFNAIDQTLIAEVSECTIEDVDRAVASASSAFKSWSNLPAVERSKLLLRWADLIDTHKEDLALIVNAEQGKPMHEALGEIDFAIPFIRWFAAEVQRMDGELIPSSSVDSRTFVLKEPIGVVAAITPWNFPVAMVLAKCAPALAAGCTVVLKPAEATPLSSLALIYLADQAGFPPGVLNVLTTSKPEIMGPVLVEHPDVRKVSFTGSTEVGKQIMTLCSAGIKKLSLELGGCAPFIVFEDADIDKAVQGAVEAKLENAGQSCVAANRFFVHELVVDEFLEKFVKAMRAYRPAPQVDLHNEECIGPMTTKAGFERQQVLVKDAAGKGACVLLGGKPSKAGGRFYEPTVLSDIKLNMQVMQQEIFGPIAPVMTFSSEAEVIELANATSYGLAAYFYSKDVTRVMRMIEALDFGVVAVNTPNFSSEMTPFGGMKQSGIGREGSKYGLNEYVELKYLKMGGLG